MEQLIPSKSTVISPVTVPNPVPLISIVSPPVNYPYHGTIDVTIGVKVP